MKQFSIAVFVAGIFLAGCSNNSVPTATSDVQSQNHEQTFTLGPIGSKASATVPTVDPAISVTASADTLLQSAGALQTVTFTVTLTQIQNAFYTLSDEYGVVSASSLLFGSFSRKDTVISVMFDLPATVDSADINGRTYAFTVIGYGTATVSASDTVVVAYTAPSSGGGDDDHDGCDDEDDNDGHGKKEHGNNGHHGKNGNNGHHGDNGNNGNNGKDQKGDKDDNKAKRH